MTPSKPAVGYTTPCPLTLTRRALSSSLCLTPALAAATAAPERATPPGGSTPDLSAQRPSLGEQGDAGAYAAIAISSTSRSMSGYQPLKMAPNSPLSARTRVCNNKCAPSLDHCICCFLQNRRLTTSFTVDSTNPVAIASPLWYRSL